jgi:NADH-ubiquinone oxidoreductase chain 5
VTTVLTSIQDTVKALFADPKINETLNLTAVGLSLYNVALFHLVDHVFYKGLLFLGADAVIHAVADNQNFRSIPLIGPESLHKRRITSMHTSSS